MLAVSLDSSNTHQQGMTSGMSGMTMREEPECIKKWKEEQEQMLKKKDADEEVGHYIKVLLFRPKS